MTQQPISILAKGSRNYSYIFADMHDFIKKTCVCPEDLQESCDLQHLFSDLDTLMTTFILHLKKFDLDETVL